MKSRDLAKVDRLYELAVWYNRLRETNNETFMPLFADTHRYLVLKGGGGSGKSIFAGRKILERATSEPGHRFLVCRKVARTLPGELLQAAAAPAGRVLPGQRLQGKQERYGHHLRQRQ